MGLAKEHGFETVERVIMPDELANAEEIFVTGTAAEVTPVGQIDEINLQVGPVTRTLMEAYDDTVNGKREAPAI